jgi:hypothetical protein
MARQRLEQRAIHRLRQVGSQTARRGRRLHQPPHHDGACVGAGERRLTRQRFEDNGAQAVHVAALVGTAFPARLFRTHVERRPHRNAGIRHRRRELLVRRARQTEVGQQRVPLGGEHDVLGLDVAVDHAVGMSVRQRFPQLGRELRRLRLAQGAARFQSVPQRPGFNERHGEPQSAAGDTGVEQWQDVRMLQTREGQDLTLEALGAQLLAGRDRQDLERDVTLVAPIERQKDHGRRALAKDLFDGVAVAELGRYPFGVGREHGEEG